MLTLQCADYVMDLNDVPFKTLTHKLKEHIGYSLSFGIITLFLLWVPIVNLFVLPAAVIGATLMMHDVFGIE